MSEKGNGFTLDPNVKQELEETSAETDLMGSWVTDEQGGDKIPLVQEWIPDGDEWQGKTIVNDREARLFALARNLPKAYDEISHMQPFIEGLFTDLDMYLTSRDGVSREQQKEVLAAMFGGQAGEQEGRGIAMSFFSNEDDD